MCYSFKRLGAVSPTAAGCAQSLESGNDPAGAAEAGKTRRANISRRQRTAARKTAEEEDDDDAGESGKRKVRKISWRLGVDDVMKRAGL